MTFFLSSTYSHSPTTQLHTGQTPPTPGEWADQIGEKGLTNLVPMFFTSRLAVLFPGKASLAEAPHNSFESRKGKVKWRNQGRVRTVWLAQAKKPGADNRNRIKTMDSQATEETLLPNKCPAAISDCRQLMA